LGDQGPTRILRRSGERAEGVALVLSGGGARGAYQAGALLALSRAFPRLRFPILTGVSAGAINSVFLAGHPAPLGRSAPALAAIWESLRADDVFRVDLPSLARHLIGWGLRLVSGGVPVGPRVRGMVDNRPLEGLLRRHAATSGDELVGISHNLHRGNVDAVALTTLNYTTGETITWIEGRGIAPGAPVQEGRWRCAPCRLTVQHVMASAALPLFFPAVRLGDSWHGDGGIHLETPFDPARQLGATKILAIAPRHCPSEGEVRRPKIHGYPPPAQILSELTNAVFLDTLDRDAERLQSMNRLLAYLPESVRGDLRPIDIVVLRPSQNLATLAAHYEDRMPRAFRYLTRSLGTRETTAPSSLSIVLFQPDYLRHLLELGAADVEARLPEIRKLLGVPADPPATAPAALKPGAESCATG
jgi:NTE family protein